MEEIHAIIKCKDLSLFHTHITRNYGKNLNQYIIDDDEGETRLTLLHLLAGIQPVASGALFLAACIRELLENFDNVDVNIGGVLKGNSHITPAHIAVQWCNVKTLEVLVEYGADLFKCDSYGQTVEDYAESVNNDAIRNVVKLAIEKSIQPYIRKFLRESALKDISSVSSICSTSKATKVSSSFCTANADDNGGGRGDCHGAIAPYNSSNYWWKKVSQFEEKFDTDYSFINHDCGDAYNVDINYILNRNKSTKYFDGSPTTSPVNVNSSKQHRKSTNIATTVKWLNDITNDPSNTVGDNGGTQHCTNDRAASSEAGSTTPDTSFIDCGDETSPKYWNPHNETIELDDDDEKISYTKHLHHTLSGSSLASDSTEATEIYIYTDKENDVELIEERYDGVPLEQTLATRTGNQSPVQSGEEGIDSEENQSTESIETIIDEAILKMTDTQLFSYLTHTTGQKPGPINVNTRRLYEKQAYRNKKQQLANNNNNDALTNDLRLACKTHHQSPQLPSPGNNGNDQEQKSNESIYHKIRNYPSAFKDLISKRFPFKHAIEFEQILINAFVKDNSQSSNINNCFCYLLLDPSITENLPTRANILLERLFGGGSLLDLVDPELVTSFIRSIFYVGKGNNNRPFQHFYEAAKCDRQQQSSNGAISPKNERILQIWRQSKGPITLHCFNGITSDEAHTREALMIEALSLSNLTNQIFGQQRCKLTLNIRQRSILGTYLLFKAYISLLFNGERQVKRLIVNGGGRIKRTENSVSGDTTLTITTTTTRRGIIKNSNNRFTTCGGA